MPPQTNHPPPRRSGLVLVAVLIVISIMSLSAYSFARWMRVEAAAAEMQLRTIQARLAAESAVELTRALLIGQRRGFPLPELDDNPQLFHNVALFEPDEDVHPRLRARFSVVAPVDTSIGLSQIAGMRYGLEDENAKLDLNAWAVRNPAGLKEVLQVRLGLPTPVAQDLIDWIDPVTHTATGFEAFSASSTPLDRYRPKNGPLTTLDELLLVRGMNRQLLDGTEDRTAGELPFRSASPNLPLSQYTTIYARASETDRFGRPKIRLNDPDMASVYRLLRTEFGEPLARFVVALRFFGSPAAHASVASVPVETQSRGDYPITSLLDLFEPQVSGTWKDRSVTFENPLVRDSSRLGEEAVRIFDRLTISPSPVRRGVINLNTASDAVLAMLPGLSEAERSQILSARLASDPPSGLARLIGENVVSPSAFRAMEPFVTDRSEVLRVRAVGSVGERGPQIQLEAVVDGTQDPPALLDYHVTGAPEARIRTALVSADEPHTLPDVTSGESAALSSTAYSRDLP